MGDFGGNSTTPSSAPPASLLPSPPFSPRWRDVHQLPLASAASFRSSEKEQLRRSKGLPKLLLTYSLSIIPEERSFGGAIVAQGNDQSYRIFATESRKKKKKVEKTNCWSFYRLKTARIIPASNRRKPKLQLEISTWLLPPHSPVEGGVLRFLPGEDVSSPHVEVDVVHWRAHAEGLASDSDIFPLTGASAGTTCSNSSFQ